MRQFTIAPPFHRLTLLFSKARIGRPSDKPVAPLVSAHLDLVPRKVRAMMLNEQLDFHDTLIDQVRRGKITPAEANDSTAKQLLPESNDSRSFGV